MKKTDQRYRAWFLEKYGGLYVYDIDLNNKYTIDHGDILFLKKYGYDLVVNPDHPNRNSTDHEYFSFMMTCLTKFYQPKRIIILHWRSSPKIYYYHQ